MILEPVNWPVVSLEYLMVPVTMLDGSDPTSLSVSFTLAAVGATPSSFQAGIWQTIGKVHYALALLGPGAPLTPVLGKQVLWMKILDSPEVAQRPVAVVIGV